MLSRAVGSLRGLALEIVELSPVGGGSGAGVVRGFVVVTVVLATVSRHPSFNLTNFHTWIRPVAVDASHVRCPIFGHLGHQS